MTTSTRRINANRNNAKKSTGPKSAQGKNVVAKNALKHGLTAQQLLLSSEDPVEFESFSTSMLEALNPVGSLEVTSAQNLIYSLWRQRRYWLAETALIEIERNPVKILARINEICEGCGLPPAYLEDLEWVPNPRIDDYKRIREEFHSFEPSLNLPSLQKLQTIYPAIYAEIVAKTKELGSSPEALYGTRQELKDFLLALSHVASTIVKEHQRCHPYRELVTLVRTACLAPNSEMQEKLARYQMLHNREIQRAMREYREMQAWRHEQQKLISS